MRHVIVGNGPAGVAAATTLRRLAPRDQVVVIAEESQPFYSKVLTSYYVGGKVPYDRMLLSNAERFRDSGIELLTGKQAVKVDPKARELLISGGERIPYDRLLIASGANPAMPPIEGAQLPGVFTLWTNDDAVQLERWIKPGQKAVIVGAGLVGLKAAEAFLMKGLSAMVVEMLDRVLPQVLAVDDALLVQRALAEKGLEVRTRTGAARIAGEGKVSSVTLTDGSVHECDVVVLATGVRPNLALAKSMGASIGRGVLVDEFMKTSVQDVFAAGDVSEGWDAVRGRTMPNPTWGNATEQGVVAAHNMAGCAKQFNGAVTLNTFTFRGFSMAAVGVTQPDGDFPRVERYANPRTGDYRKLVMLGERLVGAVAIGDIRMAGIWRGLIARKGDTASVAEALLNGKINYASSHGLAL